MAAQLQISSAGRGQVWIFFWRRASATYGEYRSGVCPPPIGGGWPCSIEPYKIGNLVASTFARYPYPESFFAWGADGRCVRVIFLSLGPPPTLDGRPRWRHPISRHDRTAPRHRPDSAGGGLRRTLGKLRRLSAFDITLEGIASQVVAQLNYRDMYREELAEVVGFTVNLTGFASTASGSHATGVGCGRRRGRRARSWRHRRGRRPGRRHGEAPRAQAGRHEKIRSMFLDPDLMIDPPTDFRAARGKCRSALRKTLDWRRR